MDRCNRGDNKRGRLKHCDEFKRVRRLGHGAPEWKDVSEQVNSVKFEVNRLLDNEVDYEHVLCPLRKRGYEWPIVKLAGEATIDMRLYKNVSLTPMLTSIHCVQPRMPLILTLSVPPKVTLDTLPSREVESRVL